jgi:hypothetical protein
MPSPKVHKLTDDQWREVFRIRCRCRRGDVTTVRELDLVGRAYKENHKRYSAMNEDVFDATVPFGSTVRARR